MKRIIEVVTVVLILCVLRLVMNIPGIHPIGAIALFGGAMLANKKLSLAITFGVLLISDLVLATLSETHMAYIGSISMAMVYLAFLGMVLIGQYYIGKRQTAGRVLAGSVVSTALFFIISNLGAWIYDPMYAKTFDGAITALANGLPFLKYDAISIVGISSAVFLVYHVYERYVMMRVTQKA